MTRRLRLSSGGKRARARGPRQALATRKSSAESWRPAIVICIHRCKSKLAIDGERRHVVLVHLQIGGVRSMLPCPRQERCARKCGMALAAGILRGHDVVDTDEAIVDRNLR